MDTRPYAVRKDGYAWKVVNLQTGRDEIDQLDLGDARIIAEEDNLRYLERKIANTLSNYSRYDGMS